MWTERDLRTGGNRGRRGGGLGRYDAVLTRVSRKNGCPRLKTKQRQGMQRCRNTFAQTVDKEDQFEMSVHRV